MFGFISYLGVFGNSLMIYILLTNETMKNIPNLYILNLAVGDLLALILCVPFISIVYSLKVIPLIPAQEILY